MFPNNSSVTRPPPSLLPGSDGTPSPAFCRYYVAATTAVVSRSCPPHFSALGLAALWLTSLVRSRLPGSPRPTRPGVVNRFHPPPVSSPRDLRLSQVPREPHCAFAVLSDSGRASVPSLRGTSVLPPLNRTERASTTMELSELYHTASALAVYASCRHYWRRRKTRFRGMANLSRVGFQLPTEFCWEVSALRLPLPLDFACRDLFPPVKPVFIRVHPWFTIPLSHNMPLAYPLAAPAAERGRNQINR